MTAPVQIGRIRVRVPAGRHDAAPRFARLLAEELATELRHRWLTTPLERPQVVLASPRIELTAGRGEAPSQLAARIGGQIAQSIAAAMEPAR